MDGSDALDADVVRVGGERREVTDVGGQHDAIGLRERHDQRVDGRASAGARSELGRAARERERDTVDDLAGAQEPMGTGIAQRLAAEPLGRAPWASRPAPITRRAADAACRREASPQVRARPTPPRASS